MIISETTEGIYAKVKNKCTTEIKRHLRQLQNNV